MAEIIREYRDQYGKLVTEYKCSVCGEPTPRNRKVGGRRALCHKCYMSEINDKALARRRAQFDNGISKAIECIKGYYEEVMCDPGRDFSHTALNDIVYRLEHIDPN